MYVHHSLHLLGVVCPQTQCLYTFPAINTKIKAELTDDLENMSYQEALETVSVELNIRRNDVLLGQANQVYENLIKVSKEKKKCQACCRGMDDQELPIMEGTVCALIPKT